MPNRGELEPIDIRPRWTGYGEEHRGSHIFCVEHQRTIWQVVAVVGVDEVPQAGVGRARGNQCGVDSVAKFRLEHVV
jgi:hypothetical protein